MPAPLAKGLAISISLLLAAGFAVYENPQVRQWVEESRRKIAFALHNLGDELEPRSNSRRSPSQDASTREDETPEAVERRRKARQEILERGRLIEERKRAQQASSARSSSFDDLVDQEGKLKHSNDQAKSTAAEIQQEQPGLRNRAVEAEGAAMGSGFANPFSDETFLESSSPATIPAQTPTQRSRSSSTATLPAAPLPPPVPPKEPLDPQPQYQKQPRLLIDTDEASNHPSEQLLDLTPTTSASSAAADLTELSQQSHHSETNYWSVHEWAANHSVPQFYTPPRSEAGAEEGDFSREQSRENVSEVGSGERISSAGSVSDMDVLSEVGGISTPGSWSEVASVVSEEY